MTLLVDLSFSFLTTQGPRSAQFEHVFKGQRWLMRCFAVNTKKHLPCKREDGILEGKTADRHLSVRSRYGGEWEHAYLCCYMARCPRWSAVATGANYAGMCDLSRPLDRLRGAVRGCHHAFRLMMGLHMGSVISQMFEVQHKEHKGPWTLFRDFITLLFHFLQKHRYVVNDWV